MFDAFLVPEKTIVTAKGDGAALDVSAASSSVFLVTLSVTDVIEQESIEITLFTSADGTTWEAKAAASFPQHFYVGEYPLLADLSAATGAKFLRAHWEANRAPSGSPPSAHEETSSLASASAKFRARRCGKLK